MRLARDKATGAYVWARGIASIRLRNLGECWRWHVDVGDLRRHDTQPTYDAARKVAVQVVVGELERLAAEGRKAEDALAALRGAP